MASEPEKEETPAPIYRKQQRKDFQGLRCKAGPNRANVQA